ncbi:MAG: sensor histidine kinase [Ruthenibacterium sp.]
MTQQKEHAAKRPRPPRSWSMRAKLMGFIVLMVAVLLGLVWFLGVRSLGTFYEVGVRRELTRTLNAFCTVLDKAGLPGEAGYDDAALLEGLEENTGLLAGKCFEVADASGRLVLHFHALQTGECLIHPSYFQAFGEKSEPAWNSDYAQALRVSVRQKGEVRFILTDQTSAQRQMVMGRRLAGGGSVIVSTDLERIEQARSVISMQLPAIAAVTLCAGILGAFLFSRWFARPITELSGAARRVAKGDYSARVTPRGHDELAVLAQDFNTMTREVARSSELQRDLIANISHDLRTPLTLIKGYAETVRDLTGADAEKRTAQMDVIIDETDRLSGLVNSVLELSKVSSGTERLSPVRFDLAQLCEEVAERYEDACAKAGCRLTVQADTPCDIMADPEALSRVVHNFLANAMHHVGADGYLALRVLPKGGGARVEVEDHGAGIPKEDLPYIFDKYYRSRADAGKQGSGLGLSICKAILVRHGFAFGAQSEVGRGSLFWFEAPGAPKQERQPKEQ